MPIEYLREGRGGVKHSNNEVARRLVSPGPGFVFVDRPFDANSKLILDLGLDYTDLKSIQWTSLSLASDNKLVEATKNNLSVPIIIFDTNAVEIERFFIEIDPMIDPEGFLRAREKVIDTLAHDGNQYFTCSDVRESSARILVSIKTKS